MHSEQTQVQLHSQGDIFTFQDWNLPPESFQPRYDIDDTSTAPDHVTAPTVTPTCGDSPSSANESELGVSSHHVSTVAMESNIRQEILSTRPFMTQVPVWPYTQLVVDMLYYYAEQVSSAMIHETLSHENAALCLYIFQEWTVIEFCSKNIEAMEFVHF